MKVLLFILFVFAYLTSFTQNKNDSFSDRFNQIIQRMITQNYRPFSLIQEMDAENKQDSLVPLLKQYERTKNEIVQDCIYESYFEYGIKSKNVLFQKEMIKYLLNACSDSIELSYSCRESISYLMQFQSNLFDKDIIDIINERVEKNNQFSLDYAYLSGKLYQYQMIPILEKEMKKLSDKRAKYKLNIVLARMGNKYSIQMIKDSLQNMSIENQLLNSEIFTYIRQKSIIDILFNDLKTNATGTPYDEPWMKKPIEDTSAYRALNILTTIVKDFPIQKKEDLSYTKKDLDKARVWAKKNETIYEIIKD